ncbi:hypothetical protein AB1K84_24100 [Mesobacillus foraminis]|uniref:hypothetical protein n=1 Tax=Mesobacillus foraminis TaxID=279826 RepID=UPI0039A0FD25
MRLKSKCLLMHTLKDFLRMRAKREAKRATMFPYRLDKPVLTYKEAKRETFVFGAFLSPCEIHYVFLDKMIVGQIKKLSGKPDNLVFILPISTTTADDDEQDKENHN